MSKVFCFLWQIAAIGTLAGCGASVEEPPRGELPGDAIAASNDAPAQSGDTEDPQREIVKRLRQIEAELNREGHKHSICHEALELAEQALQENPDLAVAYAVRADVHTDHGETREALKDYKKAFELDRYNDIYGQKLAVCYETDDQFDEALDVWDDLCRRCPNEWQNFLGRATIYSELGREEKAQADYDRALRLQQRR